MIYRLKAGGAREVQDDMGETDGVEAQDSRLSRKEHMEIRCESAMRAVSQLSGRGPLQGNQNLIMI